MGYSTQLKGYRVLDEKTFNKQKSVDLDNNSEQDVRSRDIESELERVEECRRYPEKQRCPPVCF